MIAMRYVQPPVALLKEISAVQNQDISLDVYCSDQRLLRDFFWLRLRLLTVLIRRMRPATLRCLDFGGGSGVFAASLSTGFERVTLIDRNTDEARDLIARLGIRNVDLVNADVYRHEFPMRMFDAVTAADVLEHFTDPREPIARIRRWMSDDGVLFTSLPTENACYRLLRLVFRKKKPIDHYHSAAEVEAMLRQGGFRKVMGLYHPLLLPIFPLFRISAWRKA